MQCVTGSSAARWRPGASSGAVACRRQAGGCTCQHAAAQAASYGARLRCPAALLARLLAILESDGSAFCSSLPGLVYAAMPAPALSGVCLKYRAPSCAGEM